MTKSTATLAAWIGIGVLIDVGYAAGANHGVRVLAVLLMVSAAAIVSGGFIGFLFGVPRALAARTDDQQQGSARAATYGANTNLEQVSDWLTKILIGAGLTQLGTIAGDLRRLVATVAPAVGAEASAAPFVGAQLVFFAVGGFMAGWLTTRLLLAPAMSRADQESLDRFVEAQYAEIAGNTDLAGRLRDEAIQHLGPDTRTLTRRFDDSRLLPRGPLRTAEMESIANAARQAAKNPGWSADQVRRLFEQDGPGARVFAIGLMQGNLALADFELALCAIEESKTAFEQYQGLLLVRELLDGLDATQRERLRRAVATQMVLPRRIRSNGSRWAIAQDLMTQLNRAT